MTRRESDHKRYLRQREERLKKQRAYYAEHREECITSVKASQQKRRDREHTMRNYERTSAARLAVGSGSG